jgi:MFS family permease
MAATGVTGYVPFVIGAISFICALLPTALTSKPQPRPLVSARLDVRLLYRTSPVAAIAAFSVGMANGTFGTLAPVYGYSQHLDAAGISYLMCLTIILGAASQIPFGRMSDKMDRRRVIVLLSGVAAIAGAALVILDPHGGPLLYLLFGLYGFVAYPIYGVAVAHANDSAKEGDFAKISGGMLLIMGVGLAIGPAIAPMLMNSFKPVGLFIVTAAFHGALAITTILRMQARPHVRGSRRARFLAIFTDKGQTPETVALDPRADADATAEPVN